MKTVERKDVEELARLVRKYARTGDTDLFAAETDVAESLSRRCFGDTSRRFTFKSLVECICGIYPLVKGASNDLICEVLELIGIHVIDERKES